MLRFLDTNSRSPAHLGLSIMAELKREGNVNLSNTNNLGLPVGLSMTRNPGDVASLHPENPTGFDLPATTPPDSSAGPPAYEAIAAPPPLASRSR